MAEKDKLSGDALDARAAELDIEGRSDMTADEKRAAVEEAERNPQTKTDSALKDERAAQDNQPVSSAAEYQRQLDEANGEPPADQAPGPVQPDSPIVSVVDARVRLEPRDRATYVGPINRRASDTEVDAEDFVDVNEVDEEGEEIDGDAVDAFQVLSSSGALALRTSQGTLIFDPEMARALAKDTNGALLNVVT